MNVKIKKIWDQADLRINRARSGIRRQVCAALVWALLFSLIPWPSFTPWVQQAFQNAPAGLQWAAPLALSITGWTDETLVALMGPQPVHAAGTLSLSLTGDPYAIYSTTLSFEEFSYFLTVTNTDPGPGNACSVILTQTLPAQLELVGISVIQSGGTCWTAPLGGGSVVRIRTDSGCQLGGGQTARFRVRTRVLGPLANSDFIVAPAGSYQAYNPDDGELTTYAAGLSTPVYAPKLAISKMAYPDPVIVQTERLTFTLTISNDGRYPLRTAAWFGGPVNLVITDRVPVSTTLISYSLFGRGGTLYGTALIVGDHIRWTVPVAQGGIGDWEVGEQLTATMVVTVNAPAPVSGFVVNDQYRISISESNRISPVAVGGAAVQVAITAGALDHFAVSPIGTQVAGVNFTVSITGYDRSGTLVSTLNGPVNISDLATPNTLKPTTVNFVNGVAANRTISITLARTNTALRVYTGTVSTNSNPFTVTANVPYSIGLTIARTSIPAGQNEAVNVLVQDAYANPVPGRSLNFGITRGSATPSSGVTGSNGRASFNINSTSIGPATVVVTDSGGITKSALVTFIAGCPSVLTVTVQPESLAVGNSAVITVQVRDAYGNNLDRGTATLTSLDSLGSGSISPATVSLANGGTATATVQSTLVGVKRIRAATTVAGCSSINNQDTVTFTVGSAINVAVGMSPNPREINLNATLYATVTDQYGNRVPGQNLTWTAPPGALGSGGINPNTGTTNAAGVATTSISSTLIGRVLITGTLVPTSSVSGSGYVSFTSGPAWYITVTVSPASTPAGTAAQLTISMTDRFGNPCLGQAVNLSVASPYILGSNTWIVPNPATADANGVAHATISSTLAGTVAITAQGTSTRTGSTNLIITPAALHHFLISPVSSPQQAGIGFGLTITGVDRFNNLRSGDNGTVALSDLSGTISPKQTTMSNSRATVSVVITETWTNDRITATWQTTPTISSNSNLFNVIAGPPGAIELSYPTVISACSTGNTIIATVQDAYGHPVGAGYPVTFTVGGIGSVAPTSGNTNASSQVSTQFTSTQIGVATVTAHLASGITKTARITVQTGALAAMTVDVSASLIRVGDTSRITATVSDCSGNPIANVTIHAAVLSGPGATAPVSGTSNAQGQMVFVYTGSAIGVAQIFIGDTNLIVNRTVYVTVEAQIPATMTLTATPSAILPGGDTSTLVATVRDMYGQSVGAGYVISFTRLSGPSDITLSAWSGSTDASGRVTVTLTSGATQGTAVIQAACAGITATADIVINMAVGVPFTIALTATPSRIAPSQASTITAVVQDAFGQPVGAGWVVTFSRLAGPTDVTLTPITATTNAQGQVTTRLNAGPTEGTANIQAECDGITRTVQVVIGQFMVYLPIIMRNYPLADLEIVSIEAIEQEAGRYEVRVTLRNNGPAAVPGGYWVDLYLDPTSPITLNVIWNMVSTRGKAWVVRQTLEAGQTLVLSTGDPDDPDHPEQNYSHWPGDLGGPGNHQLWAMVDCYGDAPFGAVIEHNENNNVFQKPDLISTSVAAQSNVPRLPVISRSVQPR